MGRANCAIEGPRVTALEPKWNLATIDLALQWWPVRLSVAYFQTIELPTVTPIKAIRMFAAVPTREVATWCVPICLLATM